MEKMDVETFRGLKYELESMIHEIDSMLEEGIEPSQETIEKMKNRYKEIYHTIFEHDLSEIDFEEWRGFLLYQSDEAFSVDMSHTNANLDFSIIDFGMENDVLPNFKGCNIKNFPFENQRYFPEMFDERFIEDHPEYFISYDAPEEIRQAFYERRLTIQQFSDNYSFFKGKRILNRFDVNTLTEDLYELINMYSDDLAELFEKHKPVLDILIANDGLRIINRNWETEENEVDKSREDLLKESVISYFSETNFGGRASHINEISSLEVLKDISEFVPLSKLPWRGRSRFIFNEHTPDELISLGISDMSELLEPTIDLIKIKEILDIWPDDLINLGSANNEKLKFIRKYGIDNIIKLDEETNGMFSHRIWTNSSYLELFATAEAIHGDGKITEDISYDDFKKRMYEILSHARQNRGLLKSGDFPNYDFIQGEFRSEHPDIFLDGEFSKEIKDYFYLGRLQAGNIRDNPELIHALSDKKLPDAFMNKKIMIGVGAVVLNPDGTVKGSVPYEVDMIEYLTSKFGNDAFLQLCYDYGTCLDNSYFKLDKDDSLEVVRTKIEDAIYKSITNESSTIDYFEELPETFKAKHPELFLPPEIAKSIRDKFCSGKLTFDDIKEHPELKEVLLSVNTKIGFRKSAYTSDSYGMLKEGKSELWKFFSPKELLDIAEVYGLYLEYVETDKFYEGQTLDKRIELIENDIENSILNRNAPYGEKVPEFFKKKHPELFIDPSAPEELRMYFDIELYNNIIIRNNANSDFSLVDFTALDTSHNLSFKLIKQHPEWLPYLRGKDLRLAFPKEYSKLFEVFDSNELLELGCKYPNIVKAMVDNKKEETLQRWYKKTGGRFVPHYVVMLNFPEDEIDSFLSNSKKWSRLMQSDSFNVNDDGKAAILKLSYALGVFNGNDDGFQLAMDLITSLPNELSDIDYDKLIGATSESDMKLIQDVYHLREDGKYTLNYNPQSDKQKTKQIRKLLEQANVSNILTLEKAHQLFGGFELLYNPDFIKFFKNNINRILSDNEHLSDLAQIQKRFDEITVQNASIRGGITYDVALNFIRQTPYKRDEVGNERLAKLVSQSGYSQEDFETLQELYNEGELRDFSSIPRVAGVKDGYTYEMLRLDDPLALVIGPLTDCCQKLDDAGQTCMEHSMLSDDGRVFVVRDEEGRIVAQSWVWRNGNVLCFDNIEIPEARMEQYRREHPEEGKKGLAKQILEVYKQASRELMKEDEATYLEMLEEGTITQEEYDSLILGKITVGLGWNDTADAIKEDPDLVKDDVGNLTLPEKTDRIPNPYTDAKYDPNDPKNYEGQWIIEHRNGVVGSTIHQPAVYEDDIQLYDNSNIDEVLLYSIQRMSQREKDSPMEYIDVNKSNNDRSSLEIMNAIAYAYMIKPEETRILATKRIALLFTQSNGIIRLQDLFTVPLKDGLSETQQTVAKKHINYQIKKALKQLKLSGDTVDLTDLDEDKKTVIQSLLDEIEESKKGQDNKDERGDL